MKFSSFPAIAFLSAALFNHAFALNEGPSEGSSLSEGKKESIFYEKSMTAQEVLDSAIVISLDRKPERFEFTQHLMTQASFTNIRRFSALDGSQLPVKFFAQMGIPHFSPGRMGCFASHVKVWQMIAQGDRDYVFVAEDDMIPIENFQNVFKVYWDQTPSDIDLIMVGNNIRNEGPMIQATPSACTHAYILSKKGAQIMLNIFDSFVKKNFIKNCNAVDGMTCYVMEQKMISFCSWIRKENRFPSGPGIDHGNRDYGDRYSGLCAQNFHFPSTI